MSTQIKKPLNGTVLDWSTIAPFALAVILLAVLSWPMVKWWTYEFTMPESYYAHAPVIPFIIGLMFWYRREALAQVEKKPFPAALPIVVLSLSLFLFAIKREMQAVESACFLMTIWSGVLLTMGPKFTRAAAFPLAFLVLMAPLPGPLLNDATQNIQGISTTLANKLLNLMTFSTVRDGNVIHMDTFSFSVDVPCSGFKLLLSFLTFSAAFAYLIDGDPKKRIGLFLFSLPLSLAVNGVRIALIGVVGECISESAAHVFHDWSGTITLVLGFIALFSLAKAIGCRKFAGWPIF